MTHFIELTQKIENFFSDEVIKERVINVSVEYIQYYSDKHIVFINRSIAVKESYDEIKQKIDESLKE